MGLRGKHFHKIILAMGLCWLPTPLPAQLKVMTIGDSLTEEYYFEFPFSAPAATPVLGFANTMNWVEILAQERSSAVDFGSYGNTLLSYPDFRNGGFEYNFGVPGTDTNWWMDLLDATINIFDPDPMDIGFVSTRTAMRNTYTDMDVVIIMLGGNDVNFDYGDLYSAMPGDSFANSFIAQVTGNLETMVDEVRDFDSTVPIILANVPDLGATPDIIGDHPDATRRANASAIINDLNAAITQIAANRNLTLASVSSLTDQLLSPDPFYIGAHEMVYGTDPQNPPEYLFCHQGLHPSTNGQAMIANVMIDAINSATGSSIPMLESREILTDLLGLDPDEFYSDWATNNNLADPSMSEDADGDGIPNLGEYLLGLNPTEANHNHLATIQSINSQNFLTLGYSIDEDASRLADTTPKFSTNLINWNDPPAGWIIDIGNNSQEVRVPLQSTTDHNGNAFLRLEFTLKP